MVRTHGRRTGTFHEHDHSGDRLGDDQPLEELVTNAVTDGQDGAAWETLRMAGFDAGDFLPLVSFGPKESLSNATTSTSYDHFTTQIDFKPIWSHLFPEGATTGLTFSGEVDCGTDETADVRVQNHTDGETMAEVTGLTGLDNRIGPDPVEYTPTTTDQGIIMHLDGRTDPGSNQTEFKDFQVYLGVFL